MPLDLARALNRSCCCFAHLCWSLSSLPNLCAVPLCLSHTPGRQHPWQTAVSMNLGILIPTTISFHMMLWFPHRSFSCLVTGPGLITPVALLTHSSLQHEGPQSDLRASHCHCGLSTSSFFCPGCYSFPPLSKSLGIFQNVGSSFLCSWCPFMCIQTCPLQMPEQFELSICVPNWGPFLILESHRVFIFF